MYTRRGRGMANGGRGMGMGGRGAGMGAGAGAGMGQGGRRPSGYGRGMGGRGMGMGPCGAGLRRGGGGWGFFRGGGFGGWWNTNPDVVDAEYYVDPPMDQPLNPEQERTMLQRFAAGLQNRLESIRQRLAELEQTDVEQK